MDNLIIILIIVIYGVYKIVGRVFEYKEMMEEDCSDLYDLINRLLNENRELYEKLLYEKEKRNEDRV